MIFYTQVSDAEMPPSSPAGRDLMPDAEEVAPAEIN